MSWAGDQSVDFTYSDGLPSTIPAALSLGMSGFGLTHFDIGGYTSVIRNGTTRGIQFDVKLLRDEELFMRGAEMAVFTPVMRTHEGKTFVIVQISLVIHWENTQTLLPPNSSVNGY